MRVASLLLLCLLSFASASAQAGCEQEGLLCVTAFAVADGRLRDVQDRRDAAHAQATAHARRLLRQAFSQMALDRNLSPGQTAELWTRILARAQVRETDYWIDGSVRIVLVAEVSP